MNPSNARELVLSFFSTLNDYDTVTTLQIHKVTGISLQYLRRVLTQLKYEGKITKTYPKKWKKTKEL